ncbi:MAG TPA: hypothetical protein VMI75_12050 [Polyangiaceae bacterium]|nr:hypothetical protein [Polyangiaceae bacterium]
MSNGPTDKSMTLRCTERKAAATKYISAPITVRGQPHTPQEIIAGYQAPLDARASLKAARLQVRTGLVARQAADAAMEAQDEIVQSWVDSTFGPDSQQAMDFGYAAKRTPKVTATEKVEAAEKAKATRQALGTKGKKQKKDAKKKLAAAAAQPPVLPQPTTGNGTSGQTPSKS